MIGTVVRLAQKACALSEVTGRWVSWLTLAMTGLTVLVVILRYGFGYGSIVLQESIIYFHGMVFMLGAAYTLKHDGHVRVDIFYRNFNARKKAWVDLLGTLFLLFPVCLYITYASWHYVFESWILLEGSPDAGGLPLVFILKTLILLLVLGLMLQGFADIVRHILVLKNKKEEEFDS